MAANAIKRMIEAFHIFVEVGIAIRYILDYIYIHVYIATMFILVDYSPIGIASN